MNHFTGFVGLTFYRGFLTRYRLINRQRIVYRHDQSLQRYIEGDGSAIIAIDIFLVCFDIEGIVAIYFKDSAAVFIFGLTILYSIDIINCYLAQIILYSASIHTESTVCVIFLFDIEHGSAVIGQHQFGIIRIGFIDALVLMQRIRTFQQGI